MSLLQPSLLQHPQPQTSVCLRATAPPPPPLFGCYRPISPAALAPVASGRGRRSPICREDLEGSPLCPQPKKSVWLLFFSPTGFFLGLPQPTRKIASLRTLPLSGLRLYVVAVEQPEPSSLPIRHLHPRGSSRGGVEHNTTWVGLRRNFHLRCGGSSTGPFRQGCRSWSGNWTGTSKLAGVTVFWGL